MVLSNFILSLFLIAIYSYNVNCQLDLDTNSLGEDANLTFVYINSNSALRLFPFASLSISNIVADSVGVTVSTEGVQTQKPCFTQSNTPPCETDSNTVNLNVNTAQSLLQNIYYENSDPSDGRLVVVTVTVRYEVSELARIFEAYTQLAIWRRGINQSSPSKTGTNTPLYTTTTLDLSRSLTETTSLSSLWVGYTPHFSV